MPTLHHTAVGQPKSREDHRNCSWPTATAPTILPSAMLRATIPCAIGLVISAVSPKSIRGDEERSPQFVHALELIMARRPFECHDQGHDPVDPFDTLLLRRFPVVRRVRFDRGVPPPRTKPSSNKFSSCDSAQEQVATGLTDFESLSVSPTKGTLLELFSRWLTETENSRAL